MKLLTFQLEDGMADAVRRIAREELTNISSILRKALDEELKRRGRNWRETPIHACEEAGDGSGVRDG